MNINTKTDMIPNHQCDGNEGLRNAKNEGNEGKTKKMGSTTLRVPESSLTSVLTKPVVA